MSVLRIGVLGGTFNPIHLAHVRMATAFAEDLELARVMLIPTYTPPHKQAEDLASADDRLAMCRLAVEGQPHIEVSDCEVRQRGKSYTYRTLEQLHGDYPGAELFLLMGADMFLTVQDWRESQKLFRLATLCAVPRDGGELASMREHQSVLQQLGGDCRLLSLPPMQMSSTQVRETIRAGGDAANLLHPKVWKYIQRHRLYSS